MNNVSAISVIFLSGFNETKSQRSIIFFLSLMCYCFIVLINVLLTVIIIFDHTFHEPMYIMLSAFCMNGLYGTAGFYPKFLWDLLSPVHLISYSGCHIQSHVILSYCCSEMSILALMAYDRYLAICRPLQYHSVMTNKRAIKLVCMLWLTSFCIIAANIFLTYRLKLCSSYINRLLCVNWNIVALACFSNETFINGIFANIIIIIYACHCVFIVCSYIYIVKRCAKSIENRAKFMQTCVPHLVSLIIFVSTPLTDSVNQRLVQKDLPGAFQNFVSIEFIIPPVVNPLIYGFKLTKVRNRIIMLIDRAIPVKRCSGFIKK